jgi:hypothetical protein
MPNYVVSKGHDAFVYYETVVEADTPEQARSTVKSVHYDGEWRATGYVQEFDDYEIDESSGVRLLEEGESVEEFRTIAITAQERDALTTGLRLLQLSLEAGRVAPIPRDILTNGDSHPGLDPAAIDALCQRINV